MFRSRQPKEQSAPDPTYEVEKTLPRNPAWKILFDYPETRVVVDGVDISASVREARLTAGPHGHHPQLELEVPTVASVEVIGVGEPRWVGLEHVADVALIAELQGRGYTVVPPG